jgi:RNA polymerase sigma-70 factor (ECF subfamily)
MQYEKIFKEYHGKIRAFIYKMVLDMEVASDLTQETFISFHRVLRSGKKIDGYINYLYTSARNKVYDHFDKEQRLNKIYDRYANLDHVVIDTSYEDRENEQAFQHRYNSVIAELESWPPTKGKQVMLMYYVEGLEPETIAKELNLLPHSVYTHKNRIIEKLRNKFGVLQK